jgi:hypothetical protein
VLRICSLGCHLFDDGVEPQPKTKDDTLAIIGANEQVSCKECWEKFKKILENYRED